MAYKIVNNNKKFLYVHIPKTGGTTIQDVLDVENYPKGHLSLKDLKKELGSAIIKEYITFTTVRNPWSWYVSWYFYLKQKNMGDSDFKKEYEILNKNSFEKWIKFVYNSRDSLVFENYGNNTPKYQQMLDWGFDGEKYVDYFIKIEELSEEKLREVGLDVKYTHTQSNTSKHAHYSTYYNDTTKEIVRNMHKEDIQYFNYKFEDEGDNK